MTGNSTAGTGVAPSMASQRSRRATGKKPRLMSQLRLLDCCPVLPPVSRRTSARWSWGLLAIASFSNITAGGMSLGNVVLLRHMKPEFNGTTTMQATWALSLSWSLGWILAPVVTAMCIKYGARSVCVLGGFIAGLGALFNSFSNNIVHVFLSFSVILGIGTTMVQMAGQYMLATNLTRHAGRKIKLFESTRYIGMAIFAYSIDEAVRHHGWLHGIQMTTVLVLVNFLLGFCYVPLVIERGGVGVEGKVSVVEKDVADSTATVLELLNTRVLRDRLLFYWFGVEVLLNLGLRSPIFLMVINADSDGEPYEDSTQLVVIVAISALIATFAWDIPRKCVPTSALFFIQEQMLLFVTITACVTLANDVTVLGRMAAAWGVIYGGLNAFVTSQARRLIIKEHRQQAEGLALCARGIGILFGPPLIVWLNSMPCSFRIGYLMCSAAVMLAVGGLFTIMRRLRIRELDIAYIEQSTSLAFRGTPTDHRPPGKPQMNGVLVEATVDEPDLEFRELVDPDILWRASVINNMDAPPCVAHNGIHLIGDLYEPDDDQSPEILRRRTLAEPSLPILPEVPSQEGSSLSRLDSSIHSGGRRESEVDTLVFVNSDEGGASNACFSTIDENGGTGTECYPSPPFTRYCNRHTLASPNKTWLRKGSLPEKCTLPKSPSRRLSVDPDILRTMLYLPLPRSNTMPTDSGVHQDDSGTSTLLTPGVVQENVAPPNNTPEPVTITETSV